MRVPGTLSFPRGRKPRPFATTAICSHLLPQNPALSFRVFCLFPGYPPSCTATTPKSIDPIIRGICPIRGEKQSHCPQTAVMDQTGVDSFIAAVTDPAPPAFE